MSDRGFSLVRCKNHAVWKHISGAQVVTPKTPSCSRVFKNIERDIQRALNSTLCAA
jgi:hypothetical protein